MRNFKGLKLIVAIVLTIPLVAWVVMMVNFIKNTNLVRTGKEATATVTNYASDIIINDVPMFKLYYVFTDEQGVEHEGVTSSAYTEYEAGRIHTLQIKYNSKFESIQADYKFTNTVLLWVLPIFGVAGIGFWIALIMEISSDGIAKKVIKFGTPKKATFLYSNSKMMVNDVPYFYIQFEYTDDKGNKKQHRTLCKYSYEEQAFFQQLGEFDIKEYHGHVAVNQKIDIAELNKKLKRQETGIMYKTCNYCGSTISVADKKCPNCGSNDFKTE
ncbi:MAG: hypothetical protein MJ149_03115 [Clostridia bacterium]|nr:hypothetical protein [Clostridia bacterium]